MTAIVAVILALPIVLAVSKFYNFPVKLVFFGIVLASTLSLILGSIESAFLATFTELGTLDLSWVMRYPFWYLIRERLLVYNVLFTVNTILGVWISSRLLDLNYVRLLTVEFLFVAVTLAGLAILNFL